MIYSSVEPKRHKSLEKYGVILNAVQPKKIENEEEYNFFVERLEDLLEKENDEELSLEEGFLVDLLTLIVQDYEQRVVSFPKPNPRDILEHLMESNGLKQSDLVSVIGSSGVVSEVMRGKREISKAQAKNLGKRFNVSYQLFL